MLVNTTTLSHNPYYICMLRYFILLLEIESPIILKILFIQPYFELNNIPKLCKWHSETNLGMFAYFL